MSTTTGATVHELPRQPTPDVIDTAEQALAVIRTQPDPDDLTTAYANGAVNGTLAGARFREGYQTAADAEAHDRVFGSQSWRYSPADLPTALKAASRVRFSSDARDLVENAAWLRFFGLAVDGCEDLRTCECCGRACLLGIDDVTFCEDRGEWACRWHSCEHAACAGDA